MDQLPNKRRTAAFNRPLHQRRSLGFRLKIGGIGETSKTIRSTRGNLMAALNWQRYGDVRRWK